jgi:hypothetical protein
MRFVGVRTKGQLADQVTQLLLLFRRIRDLRNKDRICLGKNNGRRELGEQLGPGR